MMEKIGEFFQFFAKLSPAKMINVVLLGVIIFIGWHSYTTQEALRVERDDFKDRWETVSDKYNAQVTENQTIQNKLQADCAEQIREFNEKRDAEAKAFTDDMKEKYSILLKKLTDKVDNDEIKHVR